MVVAEQSMIRLDRSAVMFLRKLAPTAEIAGQLDHALAGVGDREDGLLPVRLAQTECAELRDAVHGYRVENGEDEEGVPRPCCAFLDALERKLES